MGLSRTAKYYRKNAEARKKRNAYQKKYNKKRSEVEKRVELNRLNREAGTYGNGDKKDVSHKDGRKPRMQGESKNRGSKTNTSGDRRSRGGKK